MAVTSAVKEVASTNPEHNPGEHEISVRFPTTVTVAMDFGHGGEGVEVAAHSATVCILYSVNRTTFLKVA